MTTVLEARLTVSMGIYLAAAFKGIVYEFTSEIFPGFYVTPIQSNRK